MNMLLNLSAVVGLFACTAAFAGDHDLTVYQQSVHGCSQVDQNAGRCDTGNSKIGCITFKSDRAYTLQCDFAGNALLAEPETGFTKAVKDIRHEKVFALQETTLCFNFAKDEYFLWQLQKVGKPTVSCVDSGSGQDPRSRCDVSQNECDKPTIDPTTVCSPFDWTCG